MPPYGLSLDSREIRTYQEIILENKLGAIMASRIFAARESFSKDEEKFDTQGSHYIISNAYE